MATFLFGPAGFLLCPLLRTAHRAGAHPPTAAPISAAPGPFARARLAADSPRYTRLAVLLALTMIPLLGAHVLDARLFQGIGIWIKPLKFHAALVVYLLTLACFARFASAAVKGRPGWRWHERAVVLAVVLELIWIGGAAALGTRSHCNHSTPLASALYASMGVPPSC